MVSGPSRPKGWCSRDNRVLGRSDLGNGEMMLRRDILLARLVVCLWESIGKSGHVSRSWCRSKSDYYSIHTHLGPLGLGRIQRLKIHSNSLKR